MTTASCDANWRWLGCLLAALVAVLVTLFGAVTASAATATAAQTRVGPHTLVAPFVVGPQRGIGAGQRLGNDLPAYDFVLATGVAAKSVEGVLQTPSVSSVKLQNIVDNLYKGTTNPTRVGNGTTMDAIRNELVTGAPTGGRMHLTKGQESLRGLDNWLAKNPNAPFGDRLVGQSLADELRGVLPR